MRIKRYRRTPLFRPPARQRGWLPFLLWMGVVAGMAFLTRDWWLAWLRLPMTPRPQATLSAAYAAFNAGDWHTAIELARALHRDQHDSGALTLLVRTLIYRSYVDFEHRSDRARALELSQEAFAAASNQRSVQAIHALALQANERPQEAARLALRVIERDSENIVARLALALAYGSQGLFEASLREAERAVGIAQTSAPAWLWDALRVRAIALGNLGRYRDALNAINTTIENNHRLIPAHFERALFALQLGATDTATSAYFNVLAFDPNNVKARFRLCELSSVMRERQAAIAYCRDVTERAPEFVDGWYQLGREYFLQGDFANAQRALNRCAALQVLQNVPVPDRRFECWYWQGQAAEILGDCASLTAIYTEFVTMTVVAQVPQVWVYPPEGPPICQQ